ncbi:hypothetical protein GCM10028807_63010 [Spirosoma daeguense]
MKTLITIDNFREHLNKEVDVHWLCKHGGMMMPERNELIGMVPDYYFLKSIEENDEPCFWLAPVCDDDTDTVEVYRLN